MDTVQLDAYRNVGAETAKSWRQKLESGFWQKYLTGPAILEIGYRGHTPGHLPLTDGAIGLDLDYPGYDGITLPFQAGTFDAVYTSHCLEHISAWNRVIPEYHRVLKTGGHLIIVVPHAFLYERTLRIPPSKWNGDHRRAYTPASLLTEIEHCLTPNSYRVRHCCDNDLDYDYTRTAFEHPHGCYELELVIEKIAPPPWSVLS